MTPLYHIHIPATLKPYPEKHELTAAKILTRHFQADVHFVVRSFHRTADFKIGNIYWELKSPTGNGKRTIQHSLQAALKQSSNIIIDTRRAKMHEVKIVKELRWLAQEVSKIKRLIVISKDSHVIVLK